MKALLIKDFCLLKANKSYLLINLIMAIVISFASPGQGFAIGYLAYLGALYAMTSLTYDEYDNALPFIFCWPIKRDDYVKEKYLFCFASGFFALVVGFVISLLATTISGQGGLNDLLVGSSFFIAYMAILVALMLPLQLKFGSANIRVASVVILVAIGGFTYAGFMLFDKLNINIESLISSINQISLIAIALVILFAFLYFSYRMSLRIIKQKTF